MSDTKSQTLPISRKDLHRLLDTFLDDAEKHGMAVLPFFPHFLSTRVKLQGSTLSMKQRQVGGAQVLELEVWFKPEHLAPEYQGYPEKMAEAFGRMILFTMTKPGAVREIPIELNEALPVPQKE